MEEIDFQDLLKGIWKRKLIIILIILMCVFLGIFYNFKKSNELSNFSFAKASFIIIKSERKPLTDKIDGTCEKIIKTDKNLKYVIEKLDLNLTEKELSNMISLNRVDESDFFEINLKGKVNNSTQIISEILNLLNIQLKEIYEINDIYIIENPEEVKMQNDSQSDKKTIILFGLAGVIFGVIAVAGLELCDNTLKNRKQLSNYTNDIIEFAKGKNKEIELEKLKIDLKDDKIFLISCIDIDIEKNKDIFIDGFIKLFSNSKKVAYVNVYDNELVVFEILNGKKEKMRKYDEKIEELIETEKIKVILENLKNEFDKIIIDSDSTLNTVKTLKISAFSDRTIVVLKNGKTKIKNIEATLENMKKFKTKKIAIVVEND